MKRKISLHISEKERESDARREKETKREAEGGGSIQLGRTRASGGGSRCPRESSYARDSRSSVRCGPR